jgi:hypothetical protein
MNCKNILFIAAMLCVVFGGCGLYRKFRALDKDSLFILYATTYDSQTVVKDKDTVIYFKITVTVDSIRALELKYDLERINKEKVKMEIYNGNGRFVGEIVENKHSFFSCIFTDNRIKNKYKDIIDLYKDDFYIDLYIYDKNDNYKIYKYIAE